MAAVGCTRVSTDKQTTDGQKLSILNFVNDHLKSGVDDWIEVKAGSRKSAEKRKLNELKEALRKSGLSVKGDHPANVARIHGCHGPHATFRDQQGAGGAIGVHTPSQTLAASMLRKAWNVTGKPSISK